MQNIQGEGRKKYRQAPLQRTINEPSRHGRRNVTFLNENFTNYDNSHLSFDSQRSVTRSPPKKWPKKRILNAKRFSPKKKPSNLHFKVMPSVVMPAGSEAFEGSAAFSGVLETMEAPLTASRNLAMKASVCSGVLNLKYSQE